MKDQNINILKTTISNEMPGATLLQERFWHAIVELTQSLTDGQSHQVIVNWFKEKLMERTRDIGRTKSPQYSKPEIRIESYRKLISEASDRFGITDYGILMLRFLHLNFVETK